MSSSSPLSVPLREQRLLDVKLHQLPAWIMKRDFSPSGIVKAFRRGYDAYFNKYIDVKKGGIGGVSMVLAAYILLNYCAAYKELKHERRRKYH
ncbi:ATP synthase subunit f, mitochondrial [Trichosurus vulpecula]|uniref:ATP synthase subunit f, mitochondrial n=1 Tax=Trichosurus vulpecula TaxID=9337 RepID=UPI00186AC1C4|nr:ATP synthase subunit f, mitochondrial [Trichosurus vulpecula]